MINFVIGSQTDNVQKELINEMVRSYLSDTGKPHFLIVPNHIKFSSEVLTLDTLSNFTNDEEVSVKNMQVLSFSRLSWYVLKEANITLKPQLSDAAAQMIITQILTAHQQELKLYQGKTINPGTITQIYQSIGEIAASSLTPAELIQVNEQIMNPETEAKLHDLAIIMKYFMAEISQKFVTTNEITDIQNTVLAESSLFQEANFYFSDFSNFSTQELITIKILLKKAKNVTLGFKTRTGTLNQGSLTGTEYDYSVTQVVQKLLAFSKNQRLAYNIVSANLPATTAQIKKLNSIWTREISNPSAEEKRELRKAIQLVKADSRYTEANFVARTIYQLVAAKNTNYRYSDFLVLAPTLSNYETYLGPIFEQLEIPYFNDLQKEMKYHPLVILIESLQELSRHPLNSESMLEIFKTGLLVPVGIDSTQAVQMTDELENIVLKYGINHGNWQKDLAKVIPTENMTDEDLDKLSALNFFKNNLVQQIIDFQQEIATFTDTRRALTYFYQFLENNEVPKRLEDWRADATKSGNLQLAQQPEQVWDTLNSLLNDYYTINPNEFNSASFFQTLVSGFSVANFAQIPSTLDAVTVSEMGMVQASGYKEVFIVGATSGDLPQSKSNPKYLNTENITEMNTHLDVDKQISDPVQTNNCIQEYQFGQNLASATTKVYLSYPVINSENKSLLPSRYFENLRKALDLQEFTAHDLPDRGIHDILNFITRPLNSIGYLSYLKNQLEDFPTEPADLATINELISVARDNSSIDEQKIRRILRAQKFVNTPTKLTSEQAVELFGQDIYTSVSQLETFYQNPYEYFLKYGLKLRKREENEFDQIETGNYFHEIFDSIVKSLTKENLDLEQFDQFQIQNLLVKNTALIRQNPKFAHFLTNPINQYLVNELDKTAFSVLTNLQQKLTNTPLRPEYSEMTFGKNANLEGLQYDVSGHLVTLRGKIDRIDIANVGDRAFAQIVDYKSSKKSFNLNEFYNGLMLQMVSYMMVLERNKASLAKGKQLNSVGAFYQTISRKPIKLGKQTVYSDLSLHDFADDFFMNSRLDGFIINDISTIEQLEPNMHGRSKIYSGLRPTKNGISLPKNKNFTKEQFTQIFEYTNYLIRQAAAQIYSGQFAIAPYKIKKKTGMQYSDYKDIMFFDAMLPENNYHNIEQIDNEQIFQRIQEVLKDGKE